MGVVYLNGSGSDSQKHQTSSSHSPASGKVWHFAPHSRTVNVAVDGNISPQVICALIVLNQPGDKV